MACPRGAAVDYTPCRASIDGLTPFHVAPKSVTIALLALVYSDTTTNTTTEHIMNTWGSQKVVEFISHVSGNCTALCFEPFVVEVPETQHKNGDGASCRTQSEEFSELSIPGSTGYSPADYFATVVIPVSQSCSTSGSMGSGEINLDGTMVTLSRAIWMGFNWANAGGKSMDAPWPVAWQTGYTHEILHLLGAGYHSNMLQCLNPGVDQRDVLSCANAEYTDYYDLLGSSNGWAPNLNARSRYNFGWLGADDVVAIRYRGTHAIAPLNADATAATAAGAQRAAVIPSLDLWLEWRTETQAMDTGADGGGVFTRNDGLFVRRHNTMIDADLQSCDPLTEEEWKGSDDGTKSETGEIGRVTLRADRTLVLRTVGTLIQNTGVDDPDALIPKMGFAVHFTGEDPPCERAAPRIATGLFGEWQFLDDSSTGSKGESRAATFALLPNSYTRRTAHQANGIENNDAAGCGSDAAPITLSLGATDIAPLPAGWSFAVQPASATPGNAASVGFGFGIADDAADGDYDFCMVAATSSGLRSAKLFRLTLPESELQWCAISAQLFGAQFGALL